MAATSVHTNPPAPESLLSDLRMPKVAWVTLGNPEKSHSLPFSAIVPDSAPPNEKLRVVVNPGGLINVGTLKDFSAPDKIYEAPPNFYSEIKNRSPVVPILIAFRDKVEEIIRNPLREGVAWKIETDQKVLRLDATVSPSFIIHFGFDLQKGSASVVSANFQMKGEDYIEKYDSVPPFLKELRDAVLAKYTVKPVHSAVPTKSPNVLWSVLTADLGASLRRLCGFGGASSSNKTAATKNA